MTRAEQHKQPKKAIRLSDKKNFTVNQPPQYECCPLCLASGATFSFAQSKDYGFDEIKVEIFNMIYYLRNVPTSN